MNLRVENLNFAYQHGPPVLKEVSLRFDAGRVTGLFGPNGSGKSTLLRCLNGSLHPQGGHVLIGDRAAAKLSPREIARLIAVVSQDTPVALPFTALEVVLLGRYPHGESCRKDSPEDVQLARECLTKLDVAELAERRFDQLSGGERQRVIIARALAQQAPVMLWDEPASHLDINHQLGLYRLAQGLAAEGRVVVMVCHDLLLAPLFVDQAVLLNAGSICATGSIGEVLRSANISKVFGVNVTLNWPTNDSIAATLKPTVPAGSGR